MKQYDVTIGANQSGMRLDLALVEADLGLSRRKIREVIDVGGCYVNRKRIRIASRKVFTGDHIKLEYHPEGLQQAKKQNFAFKQEDILFENKYIIAVNKPPGMPSQATRSQSIIHVEAVLKKFLQERDGKGTKLFLLHRLDKETSGVLLLAKTKAAAEEVMEHFKERRVKKEYWALCKGEPREEFFKVECRLSAIDRQSGMVRVVPQGGRSSFTEFKVKAIAKGCSWVACLPHTGRSHQLRVHLEKAGYPILGDKRYGARVQQPKLPDDAASAVSLHHMLHARSLALSCQEEKLQIDAPPPQAWLRVCRAIGIQLPNSR